MIHIFIIIQSLDIYTSSSSFIRCKDAGCGIDSSDTISGSGETYSLETETSSPFKAGSFRDPSQSPTSEGNYILIVPSSTRGPQ